MIVVIGVMKVSSGDHLANKGCNQRKKPMAGLIRLSRLCEKESDLIGVW